MRERVQSLVREDKRLGVLIILLGVGMFFLAKWLAGLPLDNGFVEILTGVVAMLAVWLAFLPQEWYS